MNIPRIVIAAPCSGSGKTFCTISLLEALRRGGKKINAFKCGPDYIDPLFHKKIIGIPSKNLDLFFTDEETTRGIFLHENTGELSVIEGVMGLYDGIGGTTEKASTYHLAQTLGAPVILVVNAKGMSRSVLALVKGFLSMDDSRLINGIILNNMSQKLFPKIQALVQEETGVPVLGYIPWQKDFSISSRYLGLKLPDEIADIQQNVAKSAERLAETVDLKKLVEIAESAPAISSGFSFPKKRPPVTRIAVAKDEAFNFYYEENIQFLQNFGAQIVPFSPLHDFALPENIGGLLLGGGYPELFADRLEQNETMRQAIKAAVAGGMPVWAECGGFMYLHETIETTEKTFRMCGVVPGNCFFTGKLVRFGYVELETFGIKAHEFHYFESTANGCCCTARKPVAEEKWTCGWNINGGFQGFPHLYYPSNIAFAENIVKTAAAYRHC